MCGLQHRRQRASPWHRMSGACCMTVLAPADKASDRNIEPRIASRPAVAWICMAPLAVDKVRFCRRSMERGIGERHGMGCSDLAVAERVIEAAGGACAALMAERADRRVARIGGSMCPCPAAPGCRRMGSEHIDPVTARRVQAGTLDRSACEARAVARLAGTEPSGCSRRFFRISSMESGVRPPCRMARCRMAERIVETAGLGPRRHNRVGRRRSAAEVAERADCRVARIGGGMGPCPAPPGSGRMRSAHSCPMATRRIQAGRPGDPPAEISAMALTAGVKSACRLGRRAVYSRLRPVCGDMRSRVRVDVGPGVLVAASGNRYQENGQDPSQRWSHYLWHTLHLALF